MDERYPSKRLFRRRLGLVGCVLIVVGAVACAANPPAPLPPASQPAAPAAPSGERSVRPGINDNYREGGIEEWIARFEIESREIYAHRDEIVRLVGLRPGQTVADVGAGTGLFTPLFAEQVRPGGLVFAVDIVPRFLAYIDERARAAGFGNIRTVLCREDSVELPPDSIDIAFVCDTYHHFEYPRSSLDSIRRALRPGGQLIIVDFERIPGTSREWVLNHVRAGREEVVAEITAAGFEPLRTTSEAPFLSENYFIRFRRPD